VKRIFITDCEGPVSKNDNAFELTAHFVPHGEKLFTVISRYDDVLADIVRKPGYNAGDTLKLILPFLKAYDVTDRKMQEYSAQHLVLIPNIKDTLKHIMEVAHAFIVSTSYEHYLKALCQAIDFPYENTYCTKLKIDNYRMTREEKDKLRETVKEIAQMPIFEIPTEAKYLSDFSEEDQKIVRRLDEIFWKEIACSDCGRIFSEVNPVGGSEKAVAVRAAIRRVKAKLADVMYVGDSITDVETLKLVKENGGLSVSFNGNHYAVRNAEIAILSEHSIVTAIVADAFSRFGKKHVLRLVENWNHDALQKSQVNKTLHSSLLKLYTKELPKVKIITTENMMILAEESSKFRKQVRGEAIGRLG